VVTTGRRRLILGSAEAGGSPRELPDRVGLSAVSADGRYVATSSGRTLRVGPIDDLRSGKTVELAFSPGLLAFSPTDSGLLVIAPGYRRRPALWHWRQDRVPSAPSPGRVYMGCPASAMFSDDGRTLVTTAPGGHVLGWTMPALKPRFDVRPTGFCPSLVLLDPAGQQLLVASGNVATLVSARSGQQLLALGGHTGAITGAAFSPSGRLVATASEDGTARVWDSAGGSQLLDLRARGIEDRVAPLATVTFTPDERFVVTTDEDGVARMWEVTSRSRLGAWRARVRSATMTDAGHVRAALPDGRIVDIAADGHRQVIERLDGQGLFSVDFAPSALRGVASIFGRRGHGGGGLYALNLADHTRKKLTRRDVSNATISADGRDILVWGRRPRIWHDGRPGKVIALTRFERSGYAYGVLSDDARRALVVRYLRGARVVDVAAGKSVPLRGNVAGITSGQFSPDGRRVVTAGDRGARVWDTATGRVVAPPLGESASPVRSAAYSRPDGRDIVVLDRNGTIRIFNAATYAERSVLAPRPGDVYGVAFNSDTQTVMTVGPEGLDLRQCDVCAPPDWLEQHAQSRLTRTPEEAKEFIRKVKEG
jgi:WD40 repeat protein